MRGSTGGFDAEGSEDRERVAEKLGTGVGAMEEYDDKKWIQSEQQKKEKDRHRDVPLVCAK